MYKVGRIGSIIHPEGCKTIRQIWQHPSLTQDGETKAALKKANDTLNWPMAQDGVDTRDWFASMGFCQNMILQQMKLTQSTPHQVLSQASAPSQIGWGLWKRGTCKISPILGCQQNGFGQDYGAACGSASPCRASTSSGVKSAWSAGGLSSSWKCSVNKSCKLWW